MIYMPDFFTQKKEKKRQFEKVAVGMRNSSGE